MIVPMSHLTVLCTEKDRETALESLRSLGVLHITHETGHAAQGGLQAAESALAAAKKALEIAKEAAKTNAQGASSGSAALSPEDVLERNATVETAARDVAALEKKIALYSHFGDFDPASAEALSAQGLPVTLFKAQAAEPPKAEAGAIVKILSEDRAEKAIYGAIVGASASDAAVATATGFDIVPLPDKPLSAMERELADKKGSLATAQTALADCAGSADALAAAIKERQSERDLRAAEESMGAEGGIAWITGFCPEDKLDSVRAAAKS